MATYGTTPYTITNVTIQLTYGANNSASPFTNTLMGLGVFSASSNAIADLQPRNASNNQTVINQPIYLSNTGTADLLAGDSTVVIVLHYSINPYTT